MFIDCFLAVSLKITEANNKNHETNHYTKKLSIKLWFLATGETYNSLMYQYLISDVTISRFVPDLCDVIAEVLMDEYMLFSDTTEKCLKIAKAFEEKWQFPIVSMQWMENM